MNLKEIREILEMLKGTDVSEFELGRGDTVLKVRRGVVSGPPAAYTCVAGWRSRFRGLRLSKTIESLTREPSRVAVGEILRRRFP
mgnify:CR=1 FL=1